MADAISQVTQRRQIDAKNTSTGSLTGDTLLPGAKGAVHAPCLSICSQRRMSRSIKGACYMCHKAQWTVVMRFTHPRRTMPTKHPSPFFIHSVRLTLAKKLMLDLQLVPFHRWYVISALSVSLAVNFIPAEIG